MNKLSIQRLNRIHGQIGGIKKLIEEGNDDAKVLQQISAARGALKSLHCIYLAESLHASGSSEVQKLAEKIGKIY